MLLELTTYTDAVGKYRLCGYIGEGSNYVPPEDRQLVDESQFIGLTEPGYNNLTRFETAAKYMLQSDRHCVSELNGVYYLEFTRDDAIWALTTLIKTMASTVIENAFPVWKQSNLAYDSDYAKHAIAGLTGVTVDDVVNSMANLVGMSDDMAYLADLYNNVDNIDLSAQLAQIPEPYKPFIAEYYKTIIRTIVSYRLIRNVRNWSNAKEAEIAAMETINIAQDWEEIFRATCPVIFP